MEKALTVLERGWTFRRAENTIYRDGIAEGTVAQAFSAKTLRKSRAVMSLAYHHRGKEHQLDIPGMERDVRAELTTDKSLRPEARSVPSAKSRSWTITGRPTQCQQFADSGQLEGEIKLASSDGLAV